MWSEVVDIWHAADIGPGWEWYAEARDLDVPPPHAMTREQHAALTAPRPTGRGADWRCPRCGGPATVPTLADTLPFRRCGYAEVTPGGAWVHQ